MTADLADKASKYTQEVAVAGVGLGGLAAAYYAFTLYAASPDEAADGQLRDGSPTVMDKEEALQRK